MAVGGTLKHDFEGGPPSQTSLRLGAVVSQQVWKLIVPVSSYMAVGADEGFQGIVKAFRDSYRLMVGGGGGSVIDAQGLVEGSSGERYQITPSIGE